MPTKFAAIFLCLCCVGIALASDKPAPVPENPAAAHGVSDETGQRAAAETAAAIKALGAHPATRQISNIVFKAVRTSPASVLPIVHAAVLASPQAAAAEIVTAATAAVPDPWQKVIYHRISAPDFKGTPDGKQSADGKRTLDLAGRNPDSKPDPGTKPPAAIEDPTLTLAEAIVRTALDAQPGLSLPALVSAADLALNSDPATLLRYIQSPRAISGVGDAGSSNYANEPLRTPNQPVVSR